MLVLSTLSETSGSIDRENGIIFEVFGADGPMLGSSSSVIQALLPKFSSVNRKIQQTDGKSNARNTTFITRNTHLIHVKITEVTSVGSYYVAVMRLSVPDQIGVLWREKIREMRP
uniref:Cystatin domain-containing protein n=1 Tax=Syphacia muris TaxID=451379 RepID=A0A0N5AQV3_9BILA